MAKATAQIRRFDLREELRATASRRQHPQSQVSAPRLEASRPTHPQTEVSALTQPQVVRVLHAPADHDGNATIAARLAEMFPDVPQEVVQATLSGVMRRGSNYSQDQLVEVAVTVLAEMSDPNVTPHAETCLEPVVVGEVIHTSPRSATEESCASEESFYEMLDDLLAEMLVLSDEDARICIKTLVSIFGRIVENPEEQRFRRLKRSNVRFESDVGRHEAAVGLLQLAGFVDTTDEVDKTVQVLLFAGAVSSLEFTHVHEALNSLAESFGVESKASNSKGSANVTPASKKTEDATATVELPKAYVTSTNDRRKRVADLTEQRLRDPRGFREALRARGCFNYTPGVASHLRAKSAASTATPSRRSRHFTLADIDRMRVSDEISNMPSYAEEYRRAKHAAPAGDYSTLVARSYDPELIARQALDGTNRYRASKELSPLRWNDGIAKIAQRHAEQMASGAMPFSHDGFDQRVRAYPVPYRSAGENLALNKGVAEVAKSAVDGWIKSPGHEKNLRGAFNLCGIGAARASNGTFYLTQLFAHAA
jgi:uncharacterized protein YkwD